MDRSTLDIVLALIFQESHDKLKSELVNDGLIPTLRFQLAVDGTDCKLAALADEVQYIFDKPWNLYRCDGLTPSLGQPQRAAQTSVRQI